MLKIAINQYSKGRIMSKFNTLKIAKNAINMLKTIIQKIGPLKSLLLGPDLHIPIIYENTSPFWDIAENAINHAKYI